MCLLRIEPTLQLLEMNVADKDKCLRATLVFFLDFGKLFLWSNKNNNLMFDMGINLPRTRSPDFVCILDNIPAEQVGSWF